MNDLEDVITIIQRVQEQLKNVNNININKHCSYELSVAGDKLNKLKQSLDNNGILL